MADQQEFMNRLRPILIELDDAHAHMDSAAAALRDLRQAVADLQIAVTGQMSAPDEDDGADNRTTTCPPP